MQIFKTPCQTILNRPAFGKTILVSMNALSDHLLEPVGDDLSEEFQACVCERDRPKIIYSFRRVFLGRQGDI